MNPSCTIHTKNPKYREKMNKKTLASGTQRIQRFSNVGTQPYDPGAVSSMTREQSDMVASMVLICDDCITYHVIRCVEERVTARTSVGC